MKRGTPDTSVREQPISNGFPSMIDKSEQE
jgi:hypothetical protein